MNHKVIVNHPITNTNGTAFAIVQVNPSPLKLAISGGNRQLTFDSIRMVDLHSIAVDPDSENGIIPNVTYQWNCSVAINSTLPCFNSSSPTYPQSAAFQSANLTISTSNFILYPISSNNSNNFSDFTLSLIVTSTTTNRSITASVYISPVITPIPQITISPLLKSRQPINQKVILSSQINGNSVLNDSSHSVQWSVISANLDLDLPTTTTTGQNQPNSVVSQNVLLPNTNYVFVVHVTDISTGLVGSATIPFVTSSIPSAGNCTVIPLSGLSFSKFKLTCYNWQTDPENLPLLYSFAVVSPSGRVDSLTLFDQSNSVDVVLVGPGNVSIVATIQDQLGNTAQHPITVSISNNISSNVIDFITQSATSNLDAASRAGDVSLVNQIVLGTTSLLLSTKNDSSSPPTNVSSEIRRRLFESVNNVSINVATLSDVTTEMLLNFLIMVEKISQVPQEVTSNYRLPLSQFSIRQLESFDIKLNSLQTSINQGIDQQYQSLAVESFVAPSINTLSNVLNSMMIEISANGSVSDAENITYGS